MSLRSQRRQLYIGLRLRGSDCDRHWGHTLRALGQQSSVMSRLRDDNFQRKPYACLRTFNYSVARSEHSKC